MNQRYVKEGIYGTWAGVYVQVPGTPGKLFSYSRYRNKAHCRFAALIYLRKMLESTVLPKVAKGYYQSAPTKRSKTNLLGVHITWHHGRRVVCAECIGFKKRQWSIAKWGVTKALALAHKQRREWERTKWKRNKK